MFNYFLPKNGFICLNMRLLKHVFLVFILLSAFSFLAQAQSLKFPFPQDGSWVSDVEGLFTQEQQKELNAILAEFESRTNNEIAVITVKSFSPYRSVLEFSTDLSNNWNMLRADDKNSLIVIVSKTLGQVRITTSYGTEKLLRNEVCKKIIHSDMMPSYAIGNYFDGTKQGLLSLMREWN